MAQGRKYGTLPDLDSAPAVYATPDPTEEPSSAQAVSPESAASYKDLDSVSEYDNDDNEGEDAPSRVDRHKIRPSQARRRFRPARVDARGVDFSDRISGARKSYRVHSAQRRSRRRLLDGEDELIDEEDDGEETFEERVARLRRETEEVKAEMERRKERGETDGAQNGLVELSRALQEIQDSNRALGQKVLAKSAATNGLASDAAATPAQPPSADQDTQQVLSKAAVLEARLASLETALGAPSANSQADEAPSNVMASLASLEGKLTLLNNTSLPAIESFSRQIKQLATDADKLAESRRTARQSYESLLQQQQRASPSGQRSRPTTASSESGNRAGAQVNGDTSTASIVEDAEQRAKVESIYHTLQTIEHLSPTLPLVLDRLKTLRGLHVDASQASETLSAIEKRQGQAADDTKKWREALDGLEGAMKKAEEGALENRGVVETWVKTLEERMAKIE